MLRSSIAWIIPVAFTLVGFGSSVKSATAQTTFPFNVEYDTSVTLTPIPGSDVSTANVSGTNLINAPYGLTNFTSLNYSRTNFQNGVPVSITFAPDAATFGLQGLPIGTDRFFASGEDQLFATSKASAIFDYPNQQLIGSGSETITGGSGRFTGATGTLTFNESEPLTDPTAPLRGQASLSGSIQVPQRVPEPNNTTTVISIGGIATGVLLRRRFKSAM
ncbi:MAG: hypothetical protein PUP91_29635 [Rhizonema sp. PD37]|nr:hypothetical protein [Rhizonema sp. PD37]